MVVGSTHDRASARLKQSRKRTDTRIESLAQGKVTKTQDLGFRLLAPRLPRRLPLGIGIHNPRVVDIVEPEKGVLARFRATQ